MPNTNLAQLGFQSETMDFQPEINIQRNVYQVDALANKNPGELNRPVVKYKKKRKCMDYVKTTIPAIDWLLLNYNWSEDLLEDIMAGITVAVLNIPQGMAYSILGNVEPTVGLYMAVFPVLVYSILGTSRHISLGVLSVICLMTGKVVSTYASDTIADPEGYTNMEVATAVTMVAGLVQLLMYVFRLGMLSTILSETLVSGFTGSVAVIVITSQLKELLGVVTVRRNGPLQVVYTYYDFAVNFHTINWMTALVSAVTITILLVYNAFLKDKINKKLCMPLPIELLITVVGTTLFQITNIAEDYNMIQMGEIKSGLPGIQVPPLKLFPSVFLDACIIAVVAYSISMSLALLVSEKLKYPIDTNQELLAQGMGNVIGSLLSCLPCGASPSRSASQQTVGGKTQMASIVSAGIIVVVLLWVGVVFEPLPRCVLSSIIVVALKDIVLQTLELPRIWRNSRTDGLVWLITYAATIVLDIDVGLLIGVLVSVLCVFVKGVLIDVHALGRLPGTDLYMRLDTHGDAAEVPGVKALRFAGSVNVINRFAFKRKIVEALRSEYAADALVASAVPSVAVLSAAPPEPGSRTVVLDMAGLQYSDAAGTKLLCELFESLVADGYDVSLAAVPDASIGYMRANGLLSARFFPTVHDAVVFHQHRRQSRLLDAVVVKSANGEQKRF
ncbi:prestin-like isoform X2 [Sipha flava]|nr:prestin-like isoform X2 [Sipha flava]XP_025408067.1 prestin-like isoform X2 [Sipha flava]